MNASTDTRTDVFQAKLAKLRKATAATEKLLFGDLADSPCRVVVQPDLAAHQLQLARLSGVYGLNCLELAKILTARIKLLPKSKPVQDVARWLIGREKGLPPELQNPGGFVEIQKAAESVDVKFFMQLGECLHNLRRKSAKQKKREMIPDARLALWYWWQPNPRINWPGLAYCKHSAQWEFFDILFPRFSLGHAKNYLDNERRRMGLILSKHCFVSSISGALGNSRFS